MLLSRGASALLRLITRFIEKYGNFYAGQAWIADHVIPGRKVSLRTVKRWTAELVQAGQLAIKRRSQNTSVYSLVQAKVALQVSPQMSLRVAPRYKEEMEHRKTTYTPRVARKPPVRSLTAMEIVLARYAND